MTTKDLIIDGYFSEDILENLLPFYRQILHLYCRLRFGGDLPKLATFYGTDKWGGHWYAQHYQKHLAHLRKRKLKLLEIGIGGYDNPRWGGESLKMWRSYFPKSLIYGLDIYDKSFHEERRIKTFRGSQTDDSFLGEVIKKTGLFDIIIDDGSHNNQDVLATFYILFQNLVDGGMYVIEDTQTSYWEEFGGTSEEFNTPNTTMGFMKSLIDGLNYQELRIPDYSPGYFEKNIGAIFFYHNLVFIHKEKNVEESWRP